MEKREICLDFLSIRNILIIILTPIILLPLILCVDGDETKCAYVVIIMAVYWITEALPIAVTALLPVILFPMVGIMYAKDVSKEYLNDTSMLFVGGLIVAAAIEHWNIHKRISLRILMLVGSEPRWLMLGLMLPTWFLSMWISNTATTAMMVPIASAVLVQLKGVGTSEEEQIGSCETVDININDIKLKEKKTESKDVKNKNCDGENEDTDGVSNSSQDDDPEFLRMCKALSLAIAYSANCGGIGSLTGTGPNLVMKGQADIVFEERGGVSPITFASWMQFGLPVSAICVILLWIWFQIYFLRCRSYNSKVPGQSERVKAVVRKEYEKLGPLSFGQGAVIGHFVLLALLWITRDIGGVGGWGDIFPAKTVTDSTPAILISASLFLFPSTIPKVFCLRRDGASNKTKPLMDWSVAQHNVPWGVVILLGGGFALAKGSQNSGLSSWLGEQLTVFSSLEPWVMNLVLCYIVAAATEVTSNTATCTLMMPIMAELAFKLEVNPLYFMFPTAIATSFAFMLPVATPPNAVVFSYGYLKVKDMVTAGLLMNIVAVPVLILGTETWGEAIFGFHTLPDVFKNSSFIESTTLDPSLCVCNYNMTTTL